MEPKTTRQYPFHPPIAMNRLIEDVPFQTYADSDGMNASSLKHLLRSPAHYYQHRFNSVEKKETEALLFGKLFHYAVLEPKLFREKHVVEPIFEGRTQKGELTTSTNCKEVREKRAEWYVNLKPGSIVVPAEFLERLTMMSNKILNHKIASKLLETGSREATMWWNDRQTGELCKMRTDFISERWGIIDLKTTMDARDNAFWNQCKKLEYDVSAAHYLDGADTTRVCRSDAFTFLVIEKEDPFEIAVYPAGASILAYGSRKRSKGMQVYAECKKTNSWPGYNEKAKVLEYPDWFMAREIYEDDEET